MAVKFFMYSQDQFNEKNSILKERGKEFVPGIVVVDGAKKQFTALTNSPVLERFMDAKVVTQGEVDSFVYSMPKTVKKTGV